METGTDRTDPHTPEPAAPSGHRMPDPLDLEDLERLADPSRSLFERQPELEGVHRASALSALVDAAGSLGAVAGVALVAAVQMLVGFEPGNLLDIGLLAGFLLTVAHADLGAHRRLHRPARRRGEPARPAGPL